MLSPGRLDYTEEALPALKKKKPRQAGLFLECCTSDGLATRYPHAPNRWKLAQLDFSPAISNIVHKTLIQREST
jgi:hypothetical protein